MVNDNSTYSYRIDGRTQQVTYRSCPHKFEHQCFNSVPHFSERHPNCPRMVRDHGMDVCNVTEVQQSCALTCGMCSKEESKLRGNQVKIV